VPYLQLVGVVPAVILAVVTAVEQGSPVQGYLIGVGVVFLVAQILQDVVITPRIMGEATGLRPVVILFCVFFWGKLLGFLGVLLAIPLTCLGLAHYRRLLKAQAADMQIGI
jgi:predicted PurR-regulated permease PerM